MRSDQIKNIPILYQSSINQKQYSKQDYVINADLYPMDLHSKRNNHPKFVIIKTLHITNKQVLLSFDKKPKNRLMALLGAENQKKFLFVCFLGYKTQKSYALSVLSESIVINNQVYNFFGYSKSNMKAFSCYFYKASQQKICQIFNQLGDFDQIMSVSKKVSKLSLLYSQNNLVCSLEKQQIHIIDDLFFNNICFSDGCGYISLPLARKIKHYLVSQTQKKLEYLPSVYQIRIKGIKGVVVLNPEYKNEEIIVRKSMVKFNAKQQKLKQLLLINYSKPSSFAAINQQIIMLLSGLGVNADYFLKIQKSYIEMLKQATLDPSKHIQLLKFLGKQDLIKQVLQAKQGLSKSVKSIISQEIYKNIKTKDLKNRLRIPIERARILFGVVYPQLQGSNSKKLSLKQNQIFLRVTTAKGLAETIVGKVMVTKNPCYYCGDIRILQAVDIGDDFPFANKLSDLIIFSTEGEFPICTTISGSDYDGDQYFVCWDQNLIPEKQAKPYLYPSTKLKNKAQKVNNFDLIKYFVEYDRAIVGKINNRFLSFATISDKGVRCQQCVQLGTELFSRAIDSANTGQKIYLPDHLSYPSQSELKKNHVWVKLTQEYEQFFQQSFKFDDTLISTWNITQEMMLGIVQTYVSSTNYSNYELFKIIKAWYLEGKSKNYDLFKYVDFSDLTVQQKKQIEQFPKFPKQYLGNPFEFSPIFEDPIFQKNGIDFHTYEEAPKKWRPYYKCSGDEMDFEIVGEALEKFNNILIGIKVNQKAKLVFCLKDMKKIAYIENTIPSQNLISYYTGFNEFKQMDNLNKKQYKLFYSDQLLQIYEKNPNNSFFWFRGNQVSIDLTRFDRDILRKHQKITKQKIRHLQIFVGLSENFRVPVAKKLYVSQMPVKIQKEEQERLKYVQKKQKVKYVEKKQYIQKNEVQKKRYIEKN